MSLTKSVLASHIKDLECRASEMAVKYSKALQYGLCSADCLYKKLFIANNSIDILKRFYQEGKDCDSCDITVNQWVLTHICGYINSPYTSYICLYNYTATGSSVFVNSIWEFETDLSVNFTNYLGNESSGTYTFNDDTGVVTLTGIDFVASAVIEFSEDCSTMTWTYDNPLNTQSIIAYFTNTGVTGASCDWEEFCLTEEEVEDLISQTREILGAKCSCN